MNALQLTMTYIETAGEDPDLAQFSVELVDEAAKQRLRVKEESSRRALRTKTSHRNSSSATLETLGSR